MASATRAMIRIGVARNAPTGPHSQAQNAMLRKIASGCRLSTRRPTMAGVRNWPSIMVIAMNTAGGSSAPSRVG